MNQIQIWNFVMNKWIANNIEAISIGPETIGDITPLIQTALHISLDMN